MKRYLIYAAVYGGIGLALGLLMAWYTKDVAGQTTLITLNPDGSRPKSPVAAPLPAEEKIDVAS